MSINKAHEKKFPVKGKIVAVWGSPNSGKTTVSVKLANLLYEQYKAIVIVLFCDNEIPTLSAVFPNLKANELFSVGVPLSKTEISKDEVLKNMVTIKGKMNLGFMGYKDSENKFSYPSYDEKKAKDLLITLKEIADFVIVDCTSTNNNILSLTALENAADVFRLTTADLKDMTFFASQLPLYVDQKYRIDEHIKVLSITENKLCLPTEEIKAYCKGVSFTLPYCLTIKNQGLNGELLNNISDKKYNKEILALTEKVV